MKFRFILLFACFCSLSFGQIVVTNATFPKVGDTLKYFNTASNAIPDISKPGGGQTWDFSSLPKTGLVKLAMVNPKPLDSENAFGDATIGLEQSTLAIFYKTTNTSFERLGQKGQLAENLNIPATFRYKPTYIERRSPMKFFDINNSNYSLGVSFSTKLLPDSLLGQIGGLADSVRFSVVTSRQDIVDGFGTCKIPDGEFEVLKERRTEFSETKLELRTLLGWIDVTTLLGGIGGGAPGGLADLLGKDTTTTFYFLNDKSKEEILVVTQRDNVNNIRFKAIKLTTASNDLPLTEEATIFPNPGMDRLTVTNASNVRAIYLIDYLGRSFQPNLQREGENVSLDVKNFERGGYLLLGMDSNGKMILTKKIILH